MNPLRVLMIFLDGVGIGKKDPTVNPFFTAKLPALSKLLDGNIPYIHSKNFYSDSVCMKKLNATLGVEGLPQSGTGQTALLCGVNAAKIIGKHFGPYPYSSLRKVIKEKNIYQNLSKHKKKVFYANAYPPRYFEYIEKYETRRTATTLAYTVSGFNLNDHNKLEKKEAVASDITHEKWNAMGFPEVPTITPGQAGKRLVKFLEIYDFVFYEYFFTDHAGHSQSMAKGKEELEKIDGLLSGILEDFDKKSMLLILTSDHGNLEDLSTKSHTRNPVPLLLVGKNQTLKSLTSITQVAPGILSLYT
jgi:2,3-bisphosphoglycerate-independent phosphoglycerate mutase